MKTQTHQYQCAICPASFRTERGLVNHKHRWICKKCGTTYRTQKGYDKHTSTSCGADLIKEKEYARTEQARKDAQAFEKMVYDLKVRDGLFNPKYNVGDEVIVSWYVVTKPTHELRYKRWVRVRYEEERRYSCGKRQIRGISEPTHSDWYNILNCLKNQTQFPVNYDFGGVVVTGIHGTLDEAFDFSNAERQAYRDSCDFASRCR